MPRPPHWRLADLVDFELLLASPEAAPEQLERVRDQVLARTAAEQPNPPSLTLATPATRQQLFRQWVEVHRQNTPSDTLPGTLVGGIAAWLSVLALLAGLSLGVGLTAGLMHYRGTEPVNVAWFLVGTLGFQLTLLTVAAALGLWRAATGGLQDFHPIRRLLTWAVEVGHAGLRRLPGEKRERLRAGLACLERRREIYGSLAAWPFLIVTQLFAVAFNLGVLALLLSHVALSDVAFGWQSTLRLGPEAMHRAVSVVATPWAAFAPNPHPTLIEVTGSRFAYSEGMAPLDRRATASWWPFLAYAVTFYGLLPRVVLLAWARLSLRRSLRGLGFDHEGCHALFRGLTNSVIHSPGEPARLEIPDSAPPATAARVPTTPCLALVAVDAELTESVVRAGLRRAFGWSLSAAHPLHLDNPGANEALNAVIRSQGAAGQPIVVIARAHRAPIRAVALVLREVLRLAGPESEVVLFLVGRRQAQDFAPVDPDEFQHWRNFRAIHGLRLSLEKWTPA